MEGEASRPLDAQLEQVTASLKANLEEACGADVERLDTGEVVRIEEVLAIAGQAAKEVVSLRRKRRHGKWPRISGKRSRYVPPVRSTSSRSASLKPVIRARISAGVPYLDAAGERDQSGCGSP